MLSRILVFFILTLLLFSCSSLNGFPQNQPENLIQRGWEELVRDNDSLALSYFGQAYKQARLHKDHLKMAEALLNTGLCNYSVSNAEGISYALQAMAHYDSAATTFPEKALEGRSKCMQLIGTIYARQGKFREAINTSRTAMIGFASAKDTTGYLGLIYQLFGNAYRKLGMKDSADYYTFKALEETELTQNYVYLPTSLIAVADLYMNTDAAKSRQLIERSLAISDSMGNRQARVSSLLALHKWHGNNTVSVSDSLLTEALTTAKELRDKSFELKTILALSDYYKTRGDFGKSLEWLKASQDIKDSINNYEKLRLQKIMEAKFRLSEYERSLDLAQKENKIRTLNNYLLGGILFFTVLISILIIRYQSINVKRKKQLVETKEALLQSLAEQKKIREQQLNNELEFREDQLNAMGLQMRQKQDLMQELMQVLEKDASLRNNPELKKLVQKGQFQEKDWIDFNNWFEGINKNFYQRLKTAYPEISPNDLRLCALIRLNMSSKEMAGILNITPESVKTARYRLRKKLDLNTEDNLTDFILNL